MRRLLILLTILTLAGGASAAHAEPATADTQTQFRFELAQANGHRGPGVHGYVHNGLPWRIANVRLRVDSIDATGAVTAVTSGWIIGDVNAGGRAYFYVPITSPAETYRATVQSFDRVSREASPVQAP